jgi:hypothetical protein
MRFVFICKMAAFSDMTSQREREQAKVIVTEFRTRQRECRPILVSPFVLLRTRSNLDALFVSASLDCLQTLFAVPCGVSLSLSLLDDRSLSADFGPT